MNTNTAYMLFDCCSKTLADHIKELNEHNNLEAYSNRRAIQLFTLCSHALNGISSCCNKNVIHFDTKLSNIFISYNDTCVIGDVGVAKHFTSPFILTIIPDETTGGNISHTCREVIIAFI